MGDMNWDDTRRDALDPPLTSVATYFPDVWTERQPKSDKAYTNEQGRPNCMLSNSS